MAGLDKLREVGRRIKAAETSGPVRFVTGVTTAAPASGWITVDVGAQIVKASIPGSFRAALAEGQNVRMSVQGTLYTLDSILSTLPVPEVDAAPSGGLSDPAYLEAAGYSMAGFTAQDVVLTNYAEYVAEHLIATNAVVADLAATVAQLRQALIDQGNVQ